MSEPVAVRFRDAGKMYRIYPSRRENVIDALGLGRLLPRHHAEFREFWALRGVNLDVAAGRRLGIIGRNGAGKSTLLKMMTGNLPPTRGSIEVNGRVQALLESGGGLHPEFTGHENIYAALTYQGLSPHEIANQTEDIVEFTELGDFLDQPLKTYSLGMQARLAFAIATTVRPEILIIDEVLGAGDAYFFTKSTQRMRGLVESGATVLIVTHALDQIARFCDEAIWLERGRIMARGAALDVIKRYELYIRRLEDRRLKAKNLKTQSGRYNAMEQELYADGLTLRVSALRGSCDVAQVVLLRNGEPEDTLRVGDAQDVDPTQSAYVVAEGGWSPPKEEGDQCFRTLTGSGTVAGDAYFHLWAIYRDSTYAMGVTYRTSAGCTGTLQVLSGGTVVSSIDLRSSAQWRTEDVVIDPEQTARAEPRTIVRDRGDGAATVTASAQLARAGGAVARSLPTAGANGALSRWPGVGSLLIERVLLLDSHDVEQAIFQAAEPMKLELVFRAEKSGVFPVTLAAILYRIDGVRVSTHIGERVELSLDQGERRDAVLDFGSLNLGDGRYVATVALYESLSAHGASPFYDLLDRSYEFEVVGNPPFAGVFQHPGVWRLR